MKKIETAKHEAAQIKSDVKQVLALTEKGLTTNAIHELTGISRARVSSIKGAQRDRELLRNLPCGTAPVLSPKHTKIIALHNCGRTYKEIADALGSSRSYVRFTVQVYTAAGARELLLSAA